ncbi:MAG: magnesium transporter, partial [Clostridia bacterium]|nr:magnesium transporter [Clostridia bacterium]
MELNTTLDIEEALRLIDEKKYSDLKGLLLKAEPADVAELYDELPEELYAVIFRLLPKEPAAAVFVELDPDKQQLLINSFTDKELKGILDELYMDDTVDIIEEMPA